MYNKLAEFYDGLVGDNKAIKAYADFIEKYISGKKILELACGSGELAVLLSGRGYEVDATDISEDMLEVAKGKNSEHKVNFYNLDMRSFDLEKEYDSIICINDSFNYLDASDFNTFFNSCFASLRIGGVLVIDMHSLNRLNEFEEEFIEEGMVNGKRYVWSILSEDNSLYHSFVFYDDNANPTYENNMQNVFKPEDVLESAQNAGFDTLLLDQSIEDSCPSPADEKVFIICRKMR